MNNNELASEFVKKYPNIFNEDQDFWIEAIESLLIESSRILIANIIKKIDKE